MTDWVAFPVSLGELHKNAAKVHPDADWEGSWKRTKLLIRGAVHGRWNVRWQEYLNTPFMHPLAWVLPQLYLKIQLPYLNRHYKAEQRLRILQTHYDFMRDRMSGKLCRRLIVDGPVRLARWSTTTGDFSLMLDLPKRFWQEGELELALYHEPTNWMFAFLHFSVSGPSEISVGCMQGGKPLKDSQVSHQQLFSAFRRDMHGLRHKNFLVAVLRRLAQAWGITSLRAVSSESQVWAEKVIADYNSFWTEEGGVLRDDGMFDLPLATPSKGSRAKAMYQRRDQCLEAIGREMEQTLAEPWRSIDDALDVSFRGEGEKPAAEES
jgi:uncharacterized protein VirK/YbjX